MQSPISPAANPHQDDEQLKMLSLGYYIVGALIGLGSSLFIMHIFMGIAILNGAFEPSAQNPNNNMPRQMGWLFIGMGTGIVLFGWTTAALAIAAGRCIAKRTKKAFLQVAAALLCLWMPLGTVLGVFTFVLLGRPNVSAQFAPRAGELLR